MSTGYLQIACSSTKIVQINDLPEISNLPPTSLAPLNNVTGYIDAFIYSVLIHIEGNKSKVAVSKAKIELVEGGLSIHTVSVKITRFDVSTIIIGLGKPIKGIKLSLATFYFPKTSLLKCRVF